MSETHTISRYDGDVRWVSVSTVAKMLGISRQRVYQLIEAGGLVSVKDSNTVLVSFRSVEARGALLDREKENDYAVR